MRLLTVCGSLRAHSSNRTLLHAFAHVAPVGADVSYFERLGELPHFNPDIEHEGLPESVADWRRAVRVADAVVFSTPEYAHALPGSFKNALDWLVGGTEIVGKPIGILHVARGTTWAYDSLREVLATMSARVVEGACVSLALGTNVTDQRSLLARPEIRQALENAASALFRAAASAP